MGGRSLGGWEESGWVSGVTDVGADVTSIAQSASATAAMAPPANQSRALVVSVETEPVEFVDALQSVDAHISSQRQEVEELNAFHPLSGADSTLGCGGGGGGQRWDG